MGGALIEFTTNDEKFYPGRPESSAEDGTFEVHHVDTASVTLHVDAHNRYRPQRVRLDSAPEELTVRMDPGARVEGDGEDAQGRLRKASVHFHPEDGSVAGSSVDAEAPGGGSCSAAWSRARTRCGWASRRHGRATRPSTTRSGWWCERPAPACLQGSRGRRHGEAARGGRRRLAPPPLPGQHAFAQAHGGHGPRLVRGFIARQSEGAAIFSHVPEGRATVFFLAPKDATRFHLEELDIPAGGTLSHELTPVWRSFEFDDSEPD